jgi:hypothetical protein
MVLEVEGPWKVVLSRIERIDAGEEPTYQAKTYREDYCPLCVAPWPHDGECLCGMTR